MREHSTFGALLLAVLFAMCLLFISSIHSNNISIDYEDMPEWDDPAMTGNIADSINERIADLEQQLGEAYAEYWHVLAHQRELMEREVSD